MSFESDMRKIAAKIGGNTEQLGRAVKIELFSGVIRDTRVDTGRLRGNWQTSESAPKTGELDRLDKEGSKGADPLRSRRVKKTPVGLRVRAVAIRESRWDLCGRGS